jgi:hypothetical protein
MACCSWPVWELLQTQHTLKHECIRFSRPDEEAAAARVLDTASMEVDTFEQRALRKELSEGGRLARMRWDSLDTEAHIEGHLGRLHTS